MPIYGFECPACGHHFDRLQKMSDPDPTQCPSCGADGVRRQITAPAFRLAGSGWYETDFKKDGDKKRNLASNDAGAGSGSSTAAPASSSSSDSKPASSSSSD